MKFGKIEIRAAGKIQPTSPVIIDCTQSKWINSKGDNKTGKTTLTEALLMGIGQLSGEDIYEKLINKQTGKLDIEIPFVGNDRKSYVVKVTKSGLKLLYEGESLPSPLTKLKELLGVAGVSPMEIKDADLDDQIKWISTYTTKGVEEYNKRKAKIIEAGKKAKETRAAANKIYKAAIIFLMDEGYSDSEGTIVESKWKKSEKDYVAEPDVKELSAQLKIAGDKSDKYIQFEEKIKGKKNRKEQVESEIKKLQSELKIIEEETVKGDAWLGKNKGVRKEYDDVKKKYDNAAEDVVNYNKWQQVKAKKKEMDEAATISQKADAKEKELQAEVLEMQAEIIPDIKGVELVMQDEMKEGKLVRKEGLYKDGMSAKQMSETEWWDFVMQIWKKNKVKVVIIDNYESLGSDGVARLEQLEKEGCYIFTAEMSRETKSLEIEYQ